MPTTTRFYALTYDAVDGFREKRTPFREGHLALVREAHARGELLMAGAVGDPIEQALRRARALRVLWAHRARAGLLLAAEHPPRADRRAAAGDPAGRLYRR